MILRLLGNGVGDGWKLGLRSIRWKNIFNLVYSVFSWRVHCVLMNSRFESFLGFVEPIGYGKSSLVCSEKSHSCCMSKGSNTTYDGAKSSFSVEGLEGPRRGGWGLRGSSKRRYYGAIHA